MLRPVVDRSEVLSGITIAAVDIGASMQCVLAGDVGQAILAAP